MFNFLFGDKVVKTTTFKEKILQNSKKIYSEDDLLAFGKSCFYKGFEKAKKDDANCYTAFREEIGVLFKRFKSK